MDWKIQTRSKECGLCSGLYQDKAPYHTLLFDVDHTWTRYDICETCWKTKKESFLKEKGEFISHWQGIFQSPPPPPPEILEQNRAEELLRELLKRNLPSFAPSAFVLAAMLERKKELKIKSVKTSGETRIFIYEHPASGDIFPIVDPNLRLAQLDRVQQDVSDLFEKGIPETLNETNRSTTMVEDPTSTVSSD
ncbi:MAG TPA: hypothetical protein EYQ50_08790 [Verrucomicrobiales bacterium]|nr:hypothetical protein [Verrucomicrobiales bacterium]